MLSATNAMADGTELVLNPATAAPMAKSMETTRRINSLARERTFKAATVVKIDRTAFLSNVNFKNHHFKFLKNGGEVTDAGNWSWAGLADDGMGDAVITSYQGTLVGSFHYHGELLRLEQTASGEYLLVELDESKGRPTGDDAVGVEEGQRRAAELIESSKKIK